MKKSPLLFFCFGLIIFGLIFISISSLSEANSTVGDKYYFLKRQAIWLLLGTISLYVFSKIKLGFLKKVALPLYIVSILSLIIVLIPGIGNQALGARRWINLGFFSIQPSELVKFASIIYFPFLFSEEKNRTIKSLLIYLFIPFVLIIIEPNLSTAILVSAIVISIYFISGGNIFELLKITPLFLIGILILIVISPYRRARLEALIKPNQEQTAARYHSNQLIMAIGSGKIFGKGFANSEQKNKYLPKVSTDSILAVVGEETGFVGISIVLYLYVSLINYLYRLAKIIEEPFQQLIIIGVACWIAYQTMINMSAIVGIIPLTGVPLPFISYGGSSLLTLFAAIGLIRNIEKNNSELLYLNNDHEKNNPHHRNTSHTSNRIDTPVKRR